MTNPHHAPHEDFPSEFDAPFVLADRCGAFAPDPEEPAICTTCGWLHDEHSVDAHVEPVAA
jgi:hypothetical protein